MAKRKAVSQKPPMSEAETKRSLDMLSRLLGREEFTSFEEANEYIGKLFEKPLDRIMAEFESDTQQAISLAHKAASMEPGAEQLAVVQKSLQLDPTCIPARELQLNYTNSDEESETLCWELINLCKQQFDEKFREEFEGNYWSHRQTHPMLRTMRRLGILCFTLEKFEDGVTLLKEVLRHDAEDNLQVTADLSLYYLISGQPKIYFEHEEKYFDQLDTFSVCIAFLARFMYYAEEIFESPDDFIHGLNAFELLIVFNEMNPYLCTALTDTERPLPTKTQLKSGSKEEALHIANAVGYIIEEMPIIRVIIDEWNKSYKALRKQERAERANASQKRTNTKPTKTTAKKQTQAKEKAVAKTPTKPKK